MQIIRSIFGGVENQINFQVPILHNYNSVTLNLWIITFSIESERTK